MIKSYSSYVDALQWGGVRLGGVHEGMHRQGGREAVHVKVNGQMGQIPWPNSNSMRRNQMVQINLMISIMQPN